MCNTDLFDREKKHTKRDKVRKALRYRCPGCNRRRSRVRGEKCDHCSDIYRKPSTLARQVKKETLRKAHHYYADYETEGVL